MGHPRRYFKHRCVYFATNRLAEGLPFVPNEYINAILFGVLAAASQRFSSIKICSFSFLSNHYHLILVPEGNPAQVSDFIGYVDGETAKLLCRLLGKRNCKIWAQRPHIAQLATAEDVLKRTAYSYVNPVAANLCDTAASWTGVSSYYALVERTPRAYLQIFPTNVRKLPNGTFSKCLRRSLMRKLSKITREKITLLIDPFAWKRCFDETKNVDDSKLKEILLEKIHLEEAHYRSIRKYPVADPEKLASQNPYKRYTPKKGGRRVHCICCELSCVSS